MFNYIKIEGFRSFKHVELEPSPLSVLIGPNNSGKSNFLDLISLMAEAGQGHLSDGLAKRGGFENVAFRGGAGDVLIEFRFSPEGVFREERDTVRFKLDLKRVGLNPRVWSEQVIKDAGLHSQFEFPLTLMKRDKDGCVFRSLETGKIEKPSEGKALESDS